jgi:hypothetical protein
MEEHKLNLSGIPTPKRSLTEEETAKLYLESMISQPILLKELINQLSSIADSMSVLALYFEKKGLSDKLFVEEDLEEDE